jgi:hypothetical protein
VVDSEYLWYRMCQLEFYGLLFCDRSAVIVSPALTVAKAGIDAMAPLPERLRLAIDLRAVNAHTTPIYWPVPNMETFATKVSGKKCFAVLDMKDGFWLLPLSEKTMMFYSIGVRIAGSGRHVGCCMVRSTQWCTISQQWTLR